VLTIVAIWFVSSPSITTRREAPGAAGSRSRCTMKEAA